MKFSRLAAAALALLSLASQARVCRAQGQCRVRTCDSRTGQCSYTLAPNGTPCNDRIMCTAVDTCQGGVCMGEGSSCPRVGQCYNPGVCDLEIAQCTSSYKKYDGSSCNDGNACTQTDNCKNGTCTGTNPVVCAGPDQCHQPGTCNPATGTCIYPIKPNGSGCDDGNVCTHTDICQDGTCTGTDPVVCAAPADQCHAPGTCNPTTGNCSNPIETADTWGCINGKPCPLPTVNLTNTTIVEGFSVTINFASQLPVLATVDWGDTSLFDSGTQKSFTHTYKNDGNFTLVTNYGDTPECVGHEEISVTVVNAAPLLQLKAMQSTTVPYMAVASVTCVDSGVLDNQTIYVHWNDSSANAELHVAAPTTKNCVNLVLNHTYAKVGTYNISAMVKDNGGAYSIMVWSNTNITSSRRLLRGVDNIQDKNAAYALA